MKGKLKGSHKDVEQNKSLMTSFIIYQLSEKKFYASHTDACNQTWSVENEVSLRPYYRKGRDETRDMSAFSLSIFDRLWDQGKTEIIRNLSSQNSIWESLPNI